MEEQNVYLREVKKEDAKLIFEWSNDKEVRKNSFSTKPIIWEKHLAWFTNAINDETLQYYILCEDGIDKGQIRIKLNDDKNGVISYSIGNNYRGQGLGYKILKLAESKFCERYGNRFTLLAEVKNDNFVSQRLFKKCGYIICDKNQSETVFRKSFRE